MLFKMKSTLFTSFILVLIPAALSEIAERWDKSGCNDDNCARAVTGTRFPIAVQSSHKADCSSFMEATVIPAPITVTATTTVAPPVTYRGLQARQQTELPSVVPTYASACSGTARYSSACSCWGITAYTTTLPTPTVYATVTVSPTCPAGTLSCNGGACQDILSDPDNCGTCGNKCVSGVCQNGVCSSSTCNGSTCNSLNNCGDNCFCFETSSTAGFCGPGTSCAPLPDCNTSADCAQGEVCATGTCCGRNVCLGPQGCENGVGISERALFGRGELWTNGNHA